jgi:hypothetical protein
MLFGREKKDVPDKIEFSAEVTVPDYRGVCVFKVNAHLSLGRDEFRQDGEMVSDFAARYYVVFIPNSTRASNSLD